MGPADSVTINQECLENGGSKEKIIQTEGKIKTCTSCDRKAKPDSLQKLRLIYQAAPNLSRVRLV